MLILTNQPARMLPGHHAAAPLCGPLCRQKATVPPASNHQIEDFFIKLFNTDDFPARWHCGNWTDFHGWLYILSDLVTWAAYFAIPVMLLRMMVKRKDVALSGVVSLFLAFVFLCGLTHLVDALIFWWPVYRLSALLRLATAVVSVIAALALNRIFPVLLGLRSVRELKLEIAKRKRTEERLLQSEFMLSEAGRIARVGGWEYDLLTRKRMYSKTVYDILGLPPDHDIQHEHPMSYYPSPYRDLLEQGIRDAIQNGKKWDLETPALTQSNQMLWVRHIGEPVFNQQGQVVKVRGTLTDIDQYKKHELELSRALKAAREKTERLQKFGYILSHNVRNHTSNLAALTGMAETDSLDEDNKDLILKTRRVSQMLTSTLDDLAEVIEAQDENQAKENVSFENAAARAMAVHSLYITQAQVQINLAFQVADVQFPSLFLDSILKHLLSNAIKYRRPGQPLQVDLRSYLNDDGCIVLECQDNGLGMDLNIYGHKLFNLYATFHPSLSGRGVGLFLIKTHIESQGGEVVVSSKPEVGTTFKIMFQNEKQ